MGCAIPAGIDWCFFVYGHVLRAHRYGNKAVLSGDREADSAIQRTLGLAVLAARTWPAVASLYAQL